MILMINCKDGSKQKLTLGERFTKNENGGNRNIIEMESIIRETAMSIVGNNYSYHKLHRDD